MDRRFFFVSNASHTRQCTFRLRFTYD